MPDDLGEVMDRWEHQRHQNQGWSFDQACPVCQEAPDPVVSLNYRNAHPDLKAPKTLAQRFVAEPGVRENRAQAASRVR
jgi:hypothetical protein